MPRFIIKIHSCYLEWSTIVDAPITRGMSREDMLECSRRKYGSEVDHEARLVRADQYGTSQIMEHESAEDAIIANRAGPDETELTLEEIYERFCLPEGDDHA